MSACDPSRAAPNSGNHNEGFGQRVLQTNQEVERSIGYIPIWTTLRYLQGLARTPSGDYYRHVRNAERCDLHVNCAQEMVHGNKRNARDGMWGTKH